MWGYGYPYGFYRPHFFGFFPFGAICGGLIFLFVFFGVLRLIFFRPWRMGWGQHGPHGFGPHGHPWGGPPWMHPEGDAGQQKKEEPPTEKM